jgi:ABC-2 type transport system permease protein
MTAGTVTRAPGGKLYWAVTDCMVMTRRYVLNAIRLPDVLMFTMLQPLLFVVLFSYVFGNAIPLPGGANYREYVVVGIFVQTVAFSGMTTGAGLADELSKGLVDRFRSLPMTSSAVLVGRTVSDIARNVVTVVLMIGIALAVGWRAHSSPLRVLAGFALLLCFAFAMSWVGTLLGLVVSNSEAAVSAGLGVVFPVVWLSNAFVPIDGMMSWMRAVATWNPVSSVVVAIRSLLGNPNPIGADPGLPLRHPVLVALAWSAVLLVICVPLATRLYNRKVAA